MIRWRNWAVIGASNRSFHDREREREDEGQGGVVDRK